MRNAHKAVTLALAVFLSACGGGEDAPAEPAVDPAVTSVRVLPATVQEVQSWVYAQGTARAAEREFLTFESAGRVAYLNPNLDVGSRVSRGQLIAYQQPDRAGLELEQAQAGVAGARTDVAVARADLAEAEANLELARETFRRYETLLEQNSASQQEFDEAEARLEQARAGYAQAQAQLTAVRAQVGAAQAQVDAAEVTVAESRITSPISGVIARLNIEEGQYFSPQAVQTQTEQGALQTVPVVVIDASRFEITVDLPSYTAREVDVGDIALIRPSQAPGGFSAGRAGSGPPVPMAEFEIRGRVTAISPSLDPETRTYEAIIRTTTGAGQLQDGEFVSVWIAGEEGVEAVAVPFDAIRYISGQPTVFVFNPETRRVDAREVELGVSGTDYRAVLSGVRSGEYIVTEGVSLLTDNDRVRVIGERPRTAGGGQ